jgi:hypothetical protein
MTPADTNQNRVQFISYYQEDCICLEKKGATGSPDVDKLQNPFRKPHPVRNCSFSSAFDSQPYNSKDNTDVHLLVLQIKPEKLTITSLHHVCQMLQVPHRCSIECQDLK